MAGVVPDCCDDRIIVGATQQHDGGQFVARSIRIGRHHGAAEPEAIGPARRGKRPIAAAVDRMIQSAALDLQSGLGRRLLQHLPREVLRGRGEIGDEPLVGYTERRAGTIGRRSKMGVRGKQHDFRRRKTERRKAGMDGLLQLGAHDHEVEAEDHAAPPNCFEQHRRYLDCVEDSRDRRLARRIAGEPHRPVARGDVAICGSCKHGQTGTPAFWPRCGSGTVPVERRARS